MISEHVAEREQVVEGQIVIPFYVVCDVSYSMTPDMGALNEALDGLHQAIKDEPAVDDLARLAVLTFSDSARVETPLAQVSAVSLPRLSEQGGTNYGAAFRLIAQTIMNDEARLKREGYRIYRPCVFFLTDGMPLDSDWAASFKSELTYDPESGQGMKAHPIFVPFGFRDADESVLKRLAYPPEKGRWYLARSSDVTEALAGVRHPILQTIVTSSANASLKQRNAVQLPEPPIGSGIVSGESDYDPDFL